MSHVFFLFFAFNDKEKESDSKRAWARQERVSTRSEQKGRVSTQAQCRGQKTADGCISFQSLDD